MIIRWSCFRQGISTFSCWTERAVPPLDTAHGACFTRNRDAMAGRRLVLRHPEPCALLLLSDSVCAPFRADTEEDGIVPVRDRLRLEERLLRVVLASDPSRSLAPARHRAWLTSPQGRRAHRGQ